MIGIYVIRNLVNDKVYVGQSWDVHSRLLDHKRLLDKNEHCNIHLQRAYNMYGKDNFSFEKLEDLSYISKLDESIVQSILDVREIYWIEYFGGYNSNNTYNIRDGGWGGRYCEDYKKHLSEIRKGKYSGSNNSMYGKHHTEETKKRISEKLKGRPSPKKGKHISKEQIEILRKANLGTHHSDEFKLRVSKTLHDKFQNDETYRKTMELAHKKAGLKRVKYSDEFVLQLREEHKLGLSIKKLSIKYNIPFESCRVMIQGLGRYADIK